MLHEKELADPFSSLLKSLGTNFAPQEAVGVDQIAGKRKREEEPWKQRVAEIVRRDVCDGQKDWSPGDDTNDAVWIVNVLDYVRMRLMWYVTYYC